MSGVEHKSCRDSRNIGVDLFANELPNMQGFGDEFGLAESSFLPSLFDDLARESPQNPSVEFDTIADLLTGTKNSKSDEVYPVVQALPVLDHTICQTGLEFDDIFPDPSVKEALPDNCETSSRALEGNLELLQSQPDLETPFGINMNGQDVSACVDPFRIPTNLLPHITGDELFPYGVTADHDLLELRNEKGDLSEQKSERDETKAALQLPMVDIDTVGLLPAENTIDEPVATTVLQPNVQNCDPNASRQTVEKVPIPSSTAAQLALNRIPSGHSRASNTLCTRSVSSFEETTTDPAQPKMRYSEGASASNYCHVCGRASNTIELAACANTRIGLCRKVMCDKCLLLHQRGSFYHAKEPNSSWTCMHCRNICPKRARCHQYQKNNLRRRLRKESAAAAAAAAGEPAGAPALPSEKDNDGEALVKGIKKQERGGRKSAASVQQLKRATTTNKQSKNSRDSRSQQSTKPLHLAGPTSIPFKQHRPHPTNIGNYVTVPIPTEHTDQFPFRTMPIGHTPYQVQTLKRPRSDVAAADEQLYLENCSAKLYKVGSDSATNNISPTGIGSAVFLPNASVSHPNAFAGVKQDERATGRPLEGEPSLREKL